MADNGGSEHGSSTSEWEALLGGRGETAPTKPAMPAFRPMPVHPEPIDDADEADDVVAPVQPPAADEIQPEPGSRTFAPVMSMPLSPYLRPAGLSAETAVRDDAEDPFRRLGESAVTNATLHASGAPTPMAGVPLPSHVEPSGDGDPEDADDASDPFADDTAPFVPRFEPRGVVFAPEDSGTEDVAATDAASGDDPDAAGTAAVMTAAAAEAAAATPSAGVTTPPSGIPPTWRIPELEDTVTSAAPYRPTMRLADAPGADDEATADAGEAPASGMDASTAVLPPIAPTEEGAGDGEGGDGTDAEPGDRAPISWGIVAALVVAGLAVWGAAAYGIYLAFLAPEDVAIPAETHVAGPPGPTIDPVAPEDPSDFLAAMPLTVSTYALTESTALDPFRSGLPQRAAEAYDLVYSDGSTAVSVRAIQHYTVEEATAAYAALVGEATDREALLGEGGAELGERAILDDGTVVWRNGTAVMIASGEDPDANLEIYRLFGL